VGLIETEARGETKMATKGEAIENPMTGERIVFVETAADSGGERLKIDLELTATAHNAGTHRHAKQTERLEIVSGELEIVVGKDAARTMRKGDVVILDRGVPHVWWNASGDPARVAIEYQPALNTEEFFESFFALGRDGRTTKAGAPTFLQLVVMARHYEIYDGSAPVWLQRLVSLVLSPLAYALGYRPRYVAEGASPGERLERAA
jgi:quercetin dioxygenase-like cupin family protein